MEFIPKSNKQFLISTTLFLHLLSNQTQKWNLKKKKKRFQSPKFIETNKNIKEKTKDKRQITKFLKKWLNFRSIKSEAITRGRIETRPKLCPELVISGKNPNPNPFLFTIFVIYGLQNRASDSRYQKDRVEIRVNKRLGLFYQIQPQLHRFHNLLQKRRHLGGGGGGEMEMAEPVRKEKP